MPEAARVMPASGRELPFRWGGVRVTVDASMAPYPEPCTAATVLVVEDEVLLRWSIADHLREEGFVVIEAANADEAIAVVETTIPIDVVLSDVVMPGRMDGVGFARFVGAYRPETKVILTSGTLVAAPPGCRLDGFFLKPYDHARIVGHIRALLKDAGSSGRMDER
jgi:DNA-binding NtrC family response regulator